MELKDVLESLREGDTLTKEQVDYLVSSLGKVSAGENPNKAMSLKDFEAGLMSAFDALRNSPEGQKNLKEVIAERRTQRFTKRYTPFFNAIMAGADIATSLSQIRDSKSAQRDLTRPGLPAIPGVDPQLDLAISDAQRGTIDAARVAGPARQELQDQYAKDIALSKAVGGGQASTLGALGQVASMRRARGAANLLPAIDSIRARETGRLDDLLAMRNGQVQQNYQNRFRNAGVNLDQYNQDVTAAGNLGSVGRLNLRNSMQSLLGAAPGVIARTGQGYGDKYSQYEEQLNRSLTNTQPQYNKFTEQDIYGAQTPIQLDDNFKSGAFFNPFR